MGSRGAQEVPRNAKNCQKVSQNQEKEIKSSELDSIRDNNDEIFELKPSQNNVKGEINNKEEKSSNVSINHPRVEALIPLPPKPKYSYLKKWLLRK